MTVDVKFNVVGNPATVDVNWLVLIYPAEPNPMTVDVRAFVTVE